MTEPTPEMIAAGARAAWGGSDEVWDSFANGADFKEFARECAKRTLGAALAVDPLRREEK